MALELSFDICSISPRQWRGAVPETVVWLCRARPRAAPRNANRAGGFLLAANHISHFDPFIISSVVRRKIDWMAMAEFFPLPLLGFLLRAVDAFPADRDRADRTTIRTAIERLKGRTHRGYFSRGRHSGRRAFDCWKARRFGREHRRSRTWPAFRFSRA